MLENVEIMKKEEKTMFEQFLVNGPFSADWSTENALKYILDLKIKVSAMRETEKELKEDLGIFGLNLPDSSELSKLEKVRILCYAQTFLKYFYAGNCSYRTCMANNRRVE